MNLEGIEGEQSGINDRNINDRNIKVVLKILKLQIFKLNNKRDYLKNVLM